VTRRGTQGELAVPWRLNVALLVVSSGSALALLWGASHARSTGAVALCALAFSFVNNTVFALLHESVHGLFHSSPRANDWFGRWLAAFFPTGLTFHRVCHLGHHRRNRTAVELFDYYADGDSRVLKCVQWYGILTGVYWLVPPAGCLLFLVVPRRALAWLLDSRGSAKAEHVGAEAMLAGFASGPATRVRLEILLTIALQALFVVALDLSLAGWLACYAAFAVNWSALQYADHAWSELDVHDGAWNLTVNPLVRSLFLNYHHHLAHHQQPDVPWIHLGRFVDPARESPSFARVYLSMWKGPRPLPADARVPRAGDRAAA
jgi:fatty acid desaturase